MHLPLCLVHLLLCLGHLLLHLVHLLLHDHLVHLLLCLVPLLLNKLPLSLTNHHLHLQQHLMSPSVHLVDHTLIQTWHTTFCLAPQATLHRTTPWEWILIPTHPHLESMQTWTVHPVPKHIHHKCGVFTTDRWMVSDINLFQYIFIDFLNYQGQIHDEHGTPLPPGTPSPCESDRGQDDWTPYSDQVEFKTTDFLFHWH